MRGAARYGALMHTAWLVLISQTMGPLELVARITTLHTSPSRGETTAPPNRLDGQSIVSLPLTAPFVMGSMTTSLDPFVQLSAGVCARDFVVQH